MYLIHNIVRIKTNGNFEPTNTWDDRYSHVEVRTWFYEDSCAFWLNVSFQICKTLAKS